MEKLIHNKADYKISCLKEKINEIIDWIEKHDAVNEEQQDWQKELDKAREYKVHYKEKIQLYESVIEKMGKEIKRVREGDYYKIINENQKLQMLNQDKDDEIEKLKNKNNNLKLELQDWINMNKLKTKNTIGLNR